MKLAFVTLLLLTTVSVESPAQDSLKILSWNVKMLPSLAQAGGKAKRAKAIVQELSGLRYDVIVFQEIFHKRSRRIITKGLASKYPYHSSVLNKQLISMKFNGGVMIVSQYPISEVHEIRYKQRSGFDRMARKGAVLAEININGKPIQVAGTHLQAFGGQEIMYSQYRQLSVDLLTPNRKDGVPQLICGDFNTLKSLPSTLGAGITQNDVDRLARYPFMLQTLDVIDGDLSGSQQFTMDRPYNDLCKKRKEYRLLIDYILLRPNGHAGISVNREVKIIRSRWDALHQDLSDHFALQAMITGF